MYLKPSFTSNGDLILTAVADHPEAYGALENVMIQESIIINFTSLANDQYGRLVREYLTPSTLIRKLERRFQGRFLPTGTFLPNATSHGSSYACREITGPGSISTPECTTIIAQDNDSAKDQCALEAGNRGWFNADARPGSCP